MVKSFVRVVGGGCGVGLVFFRRVVYIFSRVFFYGRVVGSTFRVFVLGVFDWYCRLRVMCSVSVSVFGFFFFILG